MIVALTILGTSFATLFYFITGYMVADAIRLTTDNRWRIWVTLFWPLVVALAVIMLIPMAVSMLWVVRPWKRGQR